MTKSILITGGARSGKSQFAERMTLSLADEAIYIATADFGTHTDDAEMQDRIARHRRRRGQAWRTLEVPIDLSQALDATDDNQPRLVDCLTLWLSNLFAADKDWQSDVEILAQTLSGLRAPVIFVTNEVGDGIVPENRLAREFRDASGIVNQTIAAACDEVYLVVAGCPLRVKPDAR